MKLWTGRLPGGAAIVTALFGIIIGAIIGVAGGEIVLMGLVPCRSSCGSATTAR